MKKAFTLVEIIITIVILGILSAGTLISIKHLYLKVAKTKALSDLSSDSQVIVDQISSLFSDRVPSSVIGYKKDGLFETIYNLNSTYNVIEWIGVASESFKSGYYSSFVDLNASDKATSTIATPGMYQNKLNSVMQNKFGKTSSDLALIFAGSFDNGSVTLSADFNDSFGWHGNIHKQIFNISNISLDAIKLATTPNEIYEKYYLVDSAYALARGDDIDLNATCIKDLNQSDNNNTLFLFYNYRPWQGKTFCADPNGSGHDGNVTILSKNVKGLEFKLVNNDIQFNLTLEKKVRGSQNSIIVSKQKVVF